MPANVVAWEKIELVGLYALLFAKLATSELALRTDAQAANELGARMIGDG